MTISNRRGGAFISWEPRDRKGRGGDEVSKELDKSLSYSLVQKRTVDFGPEIRAT